MTKRTTTARKTTAKKPAAKRSSARKSVAKKPTATKTSARKTPARKSEAPKTAARKTVAKAKTAKPAAKTVAKRKADRDIEKAYSTKAFVSKLRRLADSLEKGKRFQIQVAGERVAVPTTPNFNIEHEREDGVEEVEFQIKWKAA